MVWMIQPVFESLQECTDSKSKSESLLMMQPGQCLFVMKASDEAAPAVPMAFNRTSLETQNLKTNLCFSKKEIITCPAQQILGHSGRGTTVRRL
jgi:hypothetical protein